MASETIFAYVGPKGSGKSHEGAKRAAVHAGWPNPDGRVQIPPLALAVRRLLRIPPPKAVRVDPNPKRRSIVIVNPDFQVGRLAAMLEVEQRELERFVRVADYDEVDGPDFWPVEAELKCGLGADGELIMGKGFDPTGWRRNRVRAGDVVIVDEAWRWLENAKTIPPAFKTALHMARHWRGPRDWSNPADVDRWLCDDPEKLWHPGLGGPVEKGGDGTPLVSMNILLLTQDYHALDAKLRRQVDQISDLNSYKAGAVPGLVQKFFPGFRTDGHYGVSTFEGHRMPQDRKSPAYSAQRRSFQKLPHLPEVHALIEKAGGQAEETRIDSRSSSKESERFKFITWWAFIVVALALVAGYKAAVGFWGMAGGAAENGKAVAASAAAAGSPGAPPAVPAPVASSAPAAAVPASSPIPPPRVSGSPVARIIGTIGDVPVVLDSNGLTRFASSSSMVRTPEVGLVGEVDGTTVSKWSAPLGATPGTARRSSFGVGGPGANVVAGLAGWDPNAGNAGGGPAVSANARAVAGREAERSGGGAP